MNDFIITSNLLNELSALNSHYRLPTTDYRLPTTDYRLPTTDYRLPTTGYRLPADLTLFEGVAQPVGQRPHRSCARGVRPARIPAPPRLLALLRNRLLATANPAAARIGLEHRHLHLAPDWKRLHHVRVAIQPGFGKRHQTGSSWRQEHEHTEAFMSLHLPGENRASRECPLWCGITNGGARGPFLDERHADPLLREVDVENLERCRRAYRYRRGPGTGLTGGRKGGCVRQRFDAGLQFDEGAELRQARDAAAPHLADRVGRPRGAPRIVLQLLQPERNLARAFVNTQYLDGDLIAGGNDRAWCGGARPAHFGNMQQALDPAAQVDEGAEVAH